jgi:hypothetical protein
MNNTRKPGHSKCGAVAPLTNMSHREPQNAQFNCILDLHNNVMAIMIHVEDMNQHMNRMVPE